MKKDFKTAKEIFHKLYKDIDGYKISLNSRSKLNLSSNELIYGEIDFDSFAQILEFINPDENTIFYDLGSGTGKPCIAISLLYEIKKAVGIELLPDLCQIAKDIYKKLKEIQPEINEIEYRCENILESDFSDGTLIFTQATCFSDETLEIINKKIEEMNKGTKIVIITKPLKSDKLKLIFENSMKMAWGIGTTRIYEKII